MSGYQLRIQLLSDSCFYRGSGAGTDVDAEMEFDPLTGLPQIGGKRIKGLFVESCRNLLYSLYGMAPNPTPDLFSVASRLLGQPDASLEDTGMLSFGNARIDGTEWVHWAIAEELVSAEEVLQSMSTLRQQTAVHHDGVARRSSLRTTRLLVRGHEMVSHIAFQGSPNEQDLALVAACALGMDRGGLSRNRGLGKLQVRLYQDVDGTWSDVTGKWFAEFGAVKKTVATQESPS